MASRIAITGAGGFIGQAVAGHLLVSGFAGEVRLFDRAFPCPQPAPIVEGDLCNPQMVEQVTNWADCVLHLAAFPGTAAAADSALSQRINVDLPRALFQRMSGKRMIYASSVAVLGSNLGNAVTDDTLPDPDSVYGTHKYQTELEFAEHIRAHGMTGLAVRIPGVVARPPASVGFGSAFLSDIFHAARTGSCYTLPVMPNATSWLISARMCAANLVHNMLSHDSDAVAVNMPALTVTIADLLAELAKSHDISGIDHYEQAVIRKAFGSHPTLTTSRGENMGMRADSDIAALVANVLADA